MSTTKEAWRILEIAEDAYHTVTITREQADSAGWLEPKQPGEILWWILDEAERLDLAGKENLREDNEGNRVHSEGVWLAADQFQDSTLLRGIAIELFMIGLQPILPTKKGDK